MLTGIINFNTDTLSEIEEDGRLFGTIIHEMGHVLGIGTLWDSLGLTSTGADGLVYNGTQAVAKYNETFGTNFSSIPVETFHFEEGLTPRTIGGVTAPGLDNEVMSQFTKTQILVSSGTTMLSQANVLPQSVLRLVGP